ncbi:hypothetical protein CYMTET_11518 [Cymbomonas tetramitiformis]|uniref:3'-5' exonuclease n=1 Tax=Cymbomonas tetramitiformis TaxID=36881 RepID=A0AAE0GLX9_9CHLO|nr:hypothetical protein CYMTET_11518 [Cymbomonas tetramitiformis]
MPAYIDFEEISLTELNEIDEVLRAAETRCIKRDGSGVPSKGVATSCLQRPTASPFMSDKLAAVPTMTNPISVATDKKSSHLLQEGKRQRVTVDTSASAEANTSNAGTRGPSELRQGAMGQVVDEVVTAHTTTLLDSQNKQGRISKRRLPASFSTSAQQPAQASEGGGSDPFPNLQYNGDVSVASSAEEVDAACHTIMATKSQVVGFDLEWKVTYKKGEPPRKVALVQLCVPTPKLHCHLLHIAHSGVTHSLRDLLTSSVPLKVGVNAVGDAQKLMRDYDINPPAPTPPLTSSALLPPA